jgi:hypothetical protein
VDVERRALLSVALILAVSGHGEATFRQPGRDAPRDSSAAERAGNAEGNSLNGSRVGAGRRPNHLLGQTSPYLLQHLYNPVDWYPWGEEALAKARREGKPIFLSIGYAACHWCHVMERESFEREDVAALLNAHFVPIKVDREERPDLDEIYMNAVQLMTGSGGWPLSVWLTPDLEPFYGGTYFPPEDRYGRPGFLTVLRKIHETWTSRGADLRKSAGELKQHLARISVSGSSAEGQRLPGRDLAARAAAELAERFDPTWGGFGTAPKFPPHGALELLLREHARSREPVPLRMVEKTLEGMARGGLYDQIGGGFHRYSTDERWLVPHFEKMLYDQALLVPIYVDAWRLTGRPLYRRVAEETLDFVRREMTHREGGFFSSLDADSEGEEGRFYLWTPVEIRTVLGDEEGSFFAGIYGIAPGGNFEGRSIPNLIAASLEERARERGLDETLLRARLSPLQAKLREARSRRPRPATDDKILTAWNGLMISAFARAYQALGRPEDLHSARRAAEFLLSRLVRNGRLAVSWREGKVQGEGFLDDHAFLARAFVDLYEASFEPRWLEEASALARALLERFEDKERGGFYFTANDQPDLIVRTRSFQDGALPSGAGVAAEVLLRLAVYFDDARLREAGTRALRAARADMERAPSAFASQLAAADFAAGPVLEIAVVGPAQDPKTRALLLAARRPYAPNRVIACAPPEPPADRWPLLRGKRMVGGKPAAYVCRNYACQAPTTDPTALEKAVRSWSSP